MNSSISSVIGGVLKNLRPVSKGEDHFQELVSIVWKFLNGSRDTACSDGEPRHSSLDLNKQFSRWADKLSGDARFQAFVRLAETIEHARTHLGWPLCAPPIPIQIPQQPSTLRGDMPHDLSDAQLWQSARQRQNFRRIVDVDEGIGELVLSLILDGGVVSYARLRAMLRSISTGISAAGPLFWTNTVDSSPVAGRYLEFRRVLLEPVTAILAMRFGAQAWQKLSTDISGTRSARRDAKHYLEMAIDTRLRALNVPRKCHPRSIDHLMSAGTALLRARIPGYLAAFARGDLKSTSVPDPVFLRLIGFEGAQRPSTPEGAGFAGDTEIVGSNEGVNPFVVTLVAEISDVLSASRRPDFVMASIAQWRQDRQAAIPPSVDALMDWVESLLGRLEPAKPTGSTTRITREAMLIAPLIAGTFGMKNPRELTVDDLVEARSEMADIVSDWLEPAATVRLISKFVDFCARCSNPEITKIGQLAEAKTPDADLLTFADIKRAIAILESGRVYVKSPEMLRNQLTFLAACSMTLRSSEARGLLFGEIKIAQPADSDAPPALVVQVRPNCLRDLKTLLSERNVPDVIVDPEIAENLIVLVSSAGSSGQSDGIFGGAAFVSSNEDWLVGRPVQTLLQGITSDRAMRPYHLRHSAASRLLVALASRFLDLSSISWIPFVGEAIALSDRIGNELINEFDLRRDLLWIVGMTMGHSFPGTTANNYIHVLDLLLYAAISDRLESPSFSMIASATGLPRSSAYRLAGGDISCGQNLARAVERAHTGRVRRYDAVDSSVSDRSDSQPMLFRRLKSIYEEIVSVCGGGVGADAYCAGQDGLLAGFRFLHEQRSGRKGVITPRHSMCVLDGPNLRVIPYPLRSLEATTAAMVLCDALESLPLMQGPTARSAVMAYVQGGHTTKARIRFPSQELAFAFVSAMQRCHAVSVKCVNSTGTRDEQATVSITARGQANERGSREGFRWVFQMLSAIQLAKHTASRLLGPGVAATEL